jgi:oligoribonuclease
MSADTRAQRIVWIDLEMTGLDPERERIIEAAVLITDSELQIVAEGPELVIHQPDTLLDGMDAWNTEHHGRSGLTDRVRASTTSEAQAEAELLAFVRQHCDEKTAPLAGNSVWQDRRFLARYMPKLETYLHYRLIDVSTLKELARRWLPEVLDSAPAKRNTHRALDDIRESLEELRHYRATFTRARD